MSSCNFGAKTFTIANPSPGKSCNFGSKTFTIAALSGITVAINYNTARRQIDAAQKNQEWERVSAWTNRVRSPTTAYSCNSEYHPMYPSMTQEDNTYLSMLNNQGTTLLSVGIESDTADAILPVWNANGTTRKNTIELNARTYLWPVLDGLVNNCQKHIYLRIHCPPACVVSRGVSGTYDEDTRRMIAAYLDVISSTKTIATNFMHFVADIVNLCYARYGGTECNQWIFSVGNEVDQAKIYPSDSNWDTANNLIAQYIWWMSNALTQPDPWANCPNARFVGCEFTGRANMDSLVQYLYNRRTSDPNNYLGQVYGLAWHPYGGGGTANPTDSCLDTAQNDPQDVLITLQPQLDAIAQAKGSPSTHIMFGEASITAQWDDPRNVSWLNAVFSTLLTVESYYCGIRAKIEFDDLGPYGFAYCLHNLTPYPVYYGQKLLKDVVNFSTSDTFCQCDGSDYTAITTFALKCPSKDVVLVFNRRSAAQTAQMNITLEAARAINGTVTQTRYEQSQNNPNVTTIGTTSIGYTNRHFTETITVPAYSLTVLTF